MKFFAYSGLIKKFAKLSQFTSIKDFNNNVEKWLADHKHTFTKSELIALKRLIRYSAKYFGVSNAKVQTLVSATHTQNDMGGVSRRTFDRAIKKAKEIGMLKVESSHKVGKRGGLIQGHNIFIFLQYIVVPIKEKIGKALKSRKHMVYKPENIIFHRESINLLETNNINNNNYNYINHKRCNWLLEPTEEEKMMIEYQNRQKRIREENSKKKFPRYNWLTT